MAAGGSSLIQLAYGQNENRDGSPLQILLITQLLIRGDKDLELLLSASQEIAVRQLRPSHLERSDNLLPAQVVAQRHWRPLIEENAHRI